MRKILGIMVVILLAGCGGQETGVPTSTNSPIPKNAKTPTLISTRTVKPTETITDKTTPTKTPFPFATPEGGVFFEEYSPNLEWAVWESYSTIDGNSIILVNLLNPEIVWNITHYETTDSGWVIDVSYQPIHWSMDGRYFYFTINRVGRCGWAQYIGYSYFKRLNLESGKLVDVLPPEGGYLVGISADSKYLAYVHDIVLTIRNLRNGEEKSLQVGGFINISSGNIRWSPDSSKLTFIMQNLDNWAVILVDREKGTYQVLLEDDENIYHVVWINDIQVKIFPTGLILNIQTGEINE